jgi:serine/threonine protein kinase
MRRDRLFNAFGRAARQAFEHELRWSVLGAGTHELVTTLPDRQMLEAVQAVHQENVVHTDLKPANFVLVKGRLKIIDFGIAKAIANDTVNIQRDQQVSNDVTMPNPN